MMNLNIYVIYILNVSLSFLFCEYVIRLDDNFKF